MLDISPKLLENVLYFSQYIVTDPGDCRDLAKYQCLTEGEYNDMREKYENDFEAGMGAEAIKKLALPRLTLMLFPLHLKKNWNLHRDRRAFDFP